MRRVALAYSYKRYFLLEGTAVIETHNPGNAVHVHVGERYDVLPSVPHRVTPLDGKSVGSSWCRVSVKRIFIWGGHDLQMISDKVSTGSTGAHPRKLCWRFKAGSQRAIRDGDRKYLRIAGNEFLFNVVSDPRERANLKDREQNVFERLKSEWEAWDAPMLPERSRPAPYNHPGNVLADHYGVVDPAPATPPSSAPTR